MGGLFSTSVQISFTFPTTTTARLDYQLGRTTFPLPHNTSSHEGSRHSVHQLVCANLNLMNL